MSPNPELKNCPFCGDVGYIRQCGYNPDLFAGRCSECDCELAVLYTERADAVTAWNHRSTMAQDVALGSNDRIQQLEAALQYYAAWETHGFIGNDGGFYPSDDAPINIDQGKTARAALTDKEAK